LIKFTPRHLSQARTWISNVICRGLLIFHIQWTKVRGDCSLCWYCWNCLPSLLKLSFHNYNGKPFFYEGANLFFCVQNHTLIPPNSSLKLISWKWSSFWLTTHLLCLMIPVFFQHTDRSYRYIDDILSLSYSKFDDNIDHIYQITF
jgi:hypothetical protein